MSSRRSLSKHSGIIAMLRWMLAIVMLASGLPGLFYASPAEARALKLIEINIDPDRVTYEEGSDGVLLAPKIKFSGPEKIYGAKVTIVENFNPEEDRLGIKKQKGVTSGKVSGLDWTYDTNKGIMTLSGEGPLGEYHAALKKVIYYNTRAIEEDEPTRKVVFSIAQDALYNPETGHYYEFVSARGISWENARKRAENSSLEGLQGYLATITSAQENEFAASKLNGTGWIGASDAETEKTWKWVTGPEAGQVFWKDGKTVDGGYSNWNKGEPNNRSNEDYGHMIFNTSIGSRGSWNDLNITGPSSGSYQPYGYVVEYGGTEGDLQPTLSDDVYVEFSQTEPEIGSLQGIEEDFKCSQAPGWTLSGSAYLTSEVLDPECDGWLRLTDNKNSQAGYGMYNEPFSSKDHIVVRFKYATYGGNGADGITFFLLDGKTPKPKIGAKGGALGYSWRKKSEPGLTNAFVGIGIDEWGNFSDKGHGGSGPGRKNHSVTIRGSGNGIEGYNYLTHVELDKAPYNTKIDGVTRDKAREVEMSIIENKITVKIDFNDGKGFQTIIDGFDLSKATGQAPVPPTFKMGFSGGTGGYRNIHEIRGLSVKKPSRLEVQVTDVTPSSAGPGDTISYKVIATNYGPNPVTGATITSKLPEGFTEGAWTCSATDGGACGSESGEGDVNGTVDLPKDGVATFIVTAKLTKIPPAVNLRGAIIPPKNITNTGENESKDDQDLNLKPTDIYLEAEDLPEDAPDGTTVGIFTAEDPDNDDTSKYTYELIEGNGDDDNGSFKITDNKLKLNLGDGNKLDPNKEYKIRVRVTDDKGGTYIKLFIIVVVNVNKAPTGISITSKQVGEGSPVDTVVGDLSTTDPDDAGGTGSYTYEIVENPGNKFKIVGNQLAVDGGLDFEDQPSYTLVIKVTDGDGASYQQKITINVTDENEPPVLDPTGNTVNLVEDGDYIFTPDHFVNRFSDPDGDKLVVIYIISLPSNGTLSYDGTDLGDLPYEVAVENIGKLKYVPDADYNGEDSFTWNNDGKDDPTATTIFNISSVNDKPRITGNSKISVDEEVATTIPVDTFTTPFEDKDDGDSLVTIKIVSLPKQGTLKQGGTEVTEGQEIPLADIDLSYTSDKDVNGKDSFRWNGSDGEEYTPSGAFVKITVTNVNDTPTGINLSKESVDENVPANSVVGILTAEDPDEGDTFTFAKATGDGTNDAENGSFEIDGNKLVIKESPDKDASPTEYHILIEVTDGKGLKFQKAFTITINPAASEDAGTFGFEAGTITVNEKDGDATFNVIRSSDTNNNPVAVKVNLVDITTVEGKDRGAFATQTLNWGNTEGGAKTVTVPIINDTDAEGNKKFRLELSDPTNGAALGTNRKLVVTLEDDESTGFEMQKSTFNLKEGDDESEMKEIASIRRNGTQGKAQIEVRITGGTAKAGVDYKLPENGVIVVDFDDSEDHKPVMLEILGDNEFETDETIELAIVTTGKGDIFGKQTDAVVTLVNDDNDIPVIEGDGEATLDEDPDAPVAIPSDQLQIKDGGNVITPTDFKIVSLPIHGKLYQNGEEITDVPVEFEDEAPNLAYKPDENYNGGDGFGWNGSDGTDYAKGAARVKLTITSKNDPPTDINLSNTNVDENVPADTEVGTLTAVDVDEDDSHAFRLVTGDGDDDNDSFKITGNKLVLKVSPNYEAKQSYTIRIQVIDEDDEKDEKQFTINVNDDASEDVGTLSFEVSTVSINENGADGKATFKVLRSSNGANNNAVSVDVSLTDDTTTASDHGNLSTSTLNWANGDGEAKTVTLPITNDTDAEGNKQFTLKLSNPGGGAGLGAITELVVTLVDDEDTGFEFDDAEGSTFVFNEGDTTATKAIATIKRSGTSGTASLEVSIDTDNSTAVAGTDYTDPAGNIAVDFADGEASKSVELEILGDTQYEEDDKTIVLVIDTTDKGDIFGKQMKATSILRNDDNAIPTISGEIEVPMNEDPGAPVAIPSNDFNTNFADEDGDAVALDTVKIVSLPENGKLYNGDPNDPANEITEDDLPKEIPFADLDLTYEPDPDYNGEDGFDWTGSDGKDYAEGFGRVVLKITSVNDAPTDIELSNETVDENVPTGTVVGILTAVDVDEGDTHTFEKATGDGTNDADNGLFAIDGNKLVINDSTPDYDAPTNRSKYNILLQATDGNGTGDSLATPKAFVITLIPAASEDIGTLAFDVDQVSLDEDSGTATFTVVRSSSTNNNAVSVQVELVDDTTSDSDHGDPSLTQLDWTDGDGDDKTFTLPIKGNDIADGNKQFRLLLSNPLGGAALGTNTELVVTIVDNEDAGFEFDDVTFAADEGDANEIKAVAVISRTGTAGTASLTVNYAGGTATATEDYTGTLTTGMFPITVDFTTGEISKAVELEILGDTQYEEDETIILEIDKAGMGAIFSEQISTTSVLRNDDAAITGTLSFASEGVTVDEDAGLVQIAVKRENGKDLDAAVDVAIESDPNGLVTLPDDTMLEWGNGDGDDKPLNIWLTDNNVAEGAAIVVLKLTNPQYGAKLGGSTVMTITVSDDESAGVQFSEGTFSAPEGNGTADVEIATLERVGGNGSLTVEVQRVGGSAVPGTDFVDSFPITVVFDDGETTKPVNLTINGNDGFGTDKSINMKLNATDSYTVGDQTNATFIIEDDDDAMRGSLQFTSGDMNATEGDGSFTLQVERVGGTDGAVSVDVGVVPVTPLNTEFVTYTNNTFFWGDGEAGAKDFTLTLEDDDKFIPVKVANLLLENIRGGAEVGITTTLAITITENDKPLPPFDLAGLQIGTNPLEVALTWDYTDTENIEGFVLLRNPDTANEEEAGRVKLTDTEVFTYVDTFDTPSDGSDLSYGVKAYRDMVLSDMDEGSTVAMTTTAYVPDIEDMAANEVTGPPEDVSVEVTWVPTDTDNVDGYDVYRGDDDTPIGTINPEDIDDTGIITFTDDSDDLTCGNSYLYRVRAKRSASWNEKAVTMNTSPCPLPELAVSLTGPITATSGSFIEYTLTITNAGFGDAVDLSAYSELPEGATFVSALSGGKKVKGENEVVWDLSYLAPGGTMSVKYTVQAFADITTTLYGAMAYDDTPDRGKVVVDGEFPVETTIAQPASDDNICELGLPANLTVQTSQATLFDQVTTAAATAANSVAEEAVERVVEEEVPAAPVVSAIAEPIVEDVSQIEMPIFPPRREPVGLQALDGDDPQVANVGPLLDAQASGNGVIRGKVVTDEGVPIPGAEIYAQWYLYQTGDGYPLPGKYTFAVSDENGDYVLRGLDENAMWALSAYPPWVGPYADYIIPEYKFVDLYATPGEYTFAEDDNFILARPNVVGRFILSDQPEKGVERGTLYIQTLDDEGNVDTNAPSWSAFTEPIDEFYGFAGGEFSLGTLPAGKSYQVFFDHLPQVPPYYDYSDYILPDPVQFEVVSDTGILDIGSFVVQRAVKFISGKVTLTDGSAVTGAEVEAVRLDQSAAPVSAQTNENGEFSIAVEGGMWLVTPAVTGKRSSNWISTNTGTVVSFTGAKDEAEIQTSDFTVNPAMSYIEGTIVRPDGAALSVGSTARTDVAISVWNVDKDMRYEVWLNQDGSFKVPAMDGYHIVTVWIDQAQRSGVAGEAIEAFEIKGNSHNTGNVALVRLIGTIEGFVSNGGEEGVAYTEIDIWEPGGRWFTTVAGDYGNYEISVPAGTWNVRPRTDADMQYSIENGKVIATNKPSFVFEGGTQVVTVLGSNRDVSVPFTMTQSIGQVSGAFVDSSGDIALDIDAIVYLTRKGSGKRIVSANVFQGQYVLPLPDDCTDCEVHADIKENAAYSLVEDMKTAGSDGAVNVKVRKNTVTLTGQFKDPETGNAITGLSGEVLLTSQDNKVPSMSTLIQSDGSYTFENVGLGEFGVTYNLQRESGKVLASGKYLAAPTFAFNITVAGDTAMTRDINLEVGEAFDVELQSDAPNANLAYPIFLSCVYTDTPTLKSTGNVTSSQVAKVSKTGECVEDPTQPGKSECARRKVSKAEQQATASLAADDAVLFSKAQPISCTVRFGNAPVNMEQLWTNPSSVAVPVTMTDKIVAEPRKRDLFIVGRVLDEDGNPVRDGSVQVDAATAGDDGQAMTVYSNANGCYQVPVSSGNNPWNIQGSQEKDGRYYDDNETYNPGSEPDDDGVKQGPTLRLTPSSEGIDGDGNGDGVGTGDGNGDGLGDGGAAGVSPLSTETQTFPTDEGISAEVEVSEEPMSCGVHTVKVRVPGDALPTNTSDVNLTIKDVRAPDTGFNTKVGRAYEIRFVEAATKRLLSDPFQRKIQVKLPYKQEDLDALGITVDDLGVGDYSFESSVWEPISDFTVDTDCQHVIAYASEPPTGIAIVIPSQQFNATFDLFFPNITR